MTITKSRLCHWSRGRIHPALVLVGSALCVFISSSRAQTYTVTDLGTLGGISSRGFAINNKGMVVGAASVVQGWVNVDHAFVWKPSTPNGTEGAMTDLAANLWGPRVPSVAIVINDFPQELGGYTHTEVFAPSTHWKDGVIAPIDLDGACWAINASGQIAGWSLYPDGLGHFEHRAFLWKPTTPNSTSGKQFWLLPYFSEAYGINDYGQVVGGPDTAFLWTPSIANGTQGTVVNIGEPASAWAINNAGQIVGSATITVSIGDGGSCACDHAFLWTPTRPNGTSGTKIHLGVLGIAPDGIRYSYARAINKLGQVVGVSSTRTSVEHPFLWDRTHGMRDLNALIPPNSGWELFEAWGINDHGQIVASGFFTDGQSAFNHAVLLTPIPTRLDSPLLQSDGQFGFSLVGGAGGRYLIQASTDLVNWTVLTNFVSASGTNQFTDPSAPNFSRRFYRVVAP